MHCSLFQYRYTEVNAEYLGIEGLLQSSKLNLLMFCYSTVLMFFRLSRASIHDRSYDDAKRNDGDTGSHAIGWLAGLPN
jgi:hypothetical protein